MSRFRLMNFRFIDCDQNCKMCDLYREGCHEEHKRRNMTKFEYIKSLTVEEMAEEFCEAIQLLDADCEKCPAYKYCYKGHNGMKHWLMTEEEI